MKTHIGIAGAGFAGAVLARELAESGKFRVSVFDEKPHVAGNCHTERDEETHVMVHKFGPHVFHTNNENVWNYVNQWGKFEPFLYRAKIDTPEGVFTNPINLQTINNFFHKKFSPHEARDFLGSITSQESKKPQNFEEQIKREVGTELFENFFKHLCFKRWGEEASRRPMVKTKEALIRFDYSDNYYSDRYQGIPVSGYTEIIRRILDHQDIEVRLGQKLEPERKREFDHLFWSGPMDGFFKFCYGNLGYRTLKFERFVANGDFQGIPMMISSVPDQPYVRMSEHKHLTPWEEHEKTICFKEFSKSQEEGDEPSYPTTTQKDFDLLDQYLKLIEKEENVTFLGRLGTYRYMDMDEVISESLDLATYCLKTDQISWPKMVQELSTRSIL